jgi:hypothetical protein
MFQVEGMGRRREEEEGGGGRRREEKGQGFFFFMPNFISQEAKNLKFFRSFGKNWTLKEFKSEKSTCCSIRF